LSRKVGRDLLHVASQNSTKRISAKLNLTVTEASNG